MTQDKTLDFVDEPAARRPVMYDMDVAIAGAGLCSTFAAIAAGRCGAKTLLIERFGILGGNIGPGMITNGGLYNEADTTLPGGLAGIPEEFIERLESLRSRPVGTYPDESNIASFLAYDMMKAAGVEILFSAHASDPILEDGVVKGLFVETRSGRMAARAKVTVDGTGVAAVARSAGATIIPYLEAREEDADYIRSAYLRKESATYYNDTQLFCVVAGVDVAKFEAFAEEEAELSEDDSEWAESTGTLSSHPKALIPALRTAWEAEGYRPGCEVGPGIRMTTRPQFRDCGDGVVAFHVTCSGAVDAGDPRQTSRIEGILRAQAYKAVKFYRQCAPGFENACLLTTSSFLGWRGGPHIEGEHTLTLEESFAGRKCDDVLYRNIHEHNHGGVASGFDVPYGIVLPKDIDGLLVCGRGAAYLRRGHDPTGMRARPSMMIFGQCVGTAAAVAALDNATPKKLDIKKVQRQLIKDGICLGDEGRLKELGLV
ncbi:MAG: FAD-dependent oxidoreductase [Dehalococcoidia bacterium]|jgi:ribulose 1,5-bisphosphate synthetase/thiazole synthase|nr:FAD-dependent oxidoreductase [Planctomycetota bacterium]MDP6274489.1 FAD-dependent oxidoreductase [Dehalococcoidia bacterium]